MNEERLNILAEWLEGGAQHERITFDMSTGLAYDEIVELDPNKIAQCGSSCCIAGAAVQFFNNPPAMIETALKKRDINESKTEIPWWTVKEEAASLLDLDVKTAHLLFEPAGGEKLAEYNDPYWAGRVIRRLIATGEVDWDACK